MVLPFIAGFVGGLIIGSLVTVAFLTLQEIMDWFSQHFNVLQKNKDNLAFSIRDKLDNGNYQIVQGIFNDRTGDVIEERNIETEEIDRELEQTHNEYEDEYGVVVYEF